MQMPRLDRENKYTHREVDAVLVDSGLLRNVLEQRIHLDGVPNLRLLLAQQVDRPEGHPISDEIDRTTSQAK